MGLKPIFADVDLNTFCVTAENIKKNFKKNKIDSHNSYIRKCFEINQLLNYLKKKNSIIRRLSRVVWLKI